MSTKKDKNLGLRLKSYRKEKNLTLQQLGKIIKISHGSLSSLENQKSAPSAETLQNLCLYTDIDIIWLLTGKRKNEIDQPPSAISTPFLAELETWAREISGQNNLAWLEKQLEECLPTFKMWRERKKSENNNQNQQVA